MFDIIFKKVRENCYVVDKSSTIFTMFFQYPIYKILYIKGRIYIFYKNYIETLHLLLIDKDKTIPII